MTPLIEIKNIPIEIEMKISHAELKYTHGTADLEISKDKNGMRVRSKPIQVNVDTFDSQGIVVPTTAKQSETGASKHSTYQQATASYQNKGQDLLLNAKIDQEVLSHLVRGNLSSVPSAKGETPDAPVAQSAEMNIRFEMDKLNFDMRLSNQEFEFTPGSIEFSVSQRPEVVITYVGEPIYVPPSSNPNYEPVDVQA